MKSKLLCLAFLVAVLTFCGPTFAHHGSAAYSNAVTVASLEGERNDNRIQETNGRRERRCRSGLGLPQP
jgi:hypothetical protein